MPPQTGQWNWPEIKNLGVATIGQQGIHLNSALLKIKENTLTKVTRVTRYHEFNL